MQFIAPTPQAATTGAQAIVAVALSSA